MKRILYLIAVFALFGLVSCEQDETIFDVPEKENETQNKPDKEEDKNDEQVVNNPLQMTADLEAMVGSRAGIKTEWQLGNIMGLLTDGENLAFTYNGEKWIADEPYQVDNTQTVYAYYPYYESLTDGRYAPIDVALQEDILYGSTNVTPDFPVAALKMKHAMSLVRVKLLRDEYMGTGMVNSVKFENLPAKKMLGIQTGTVYSVPGNNEKCTYTAGGNFMLNDANPVISEVIVPPGMPDGQQVTFEIDGKSMTFVFPSQHDWEPGMMYTYSIKIKGIYNAEIKVDDVPIDVEYWSQYGKTDNVVLKEVDDFEDMFLIKPFYTEYGYDTYRNEGKVFGTYMAHMGSRQFDGKVRFVLMQGDRIVEKFQPVDLKMKGGWTTKRVQCYVTAAPGTYQLVPLFQRNGESTWFKAYDYASGNQQEWMYEVMDAAPDLPALRDIYLENEGDNINEFFYRIPYNKNFGVVYTLSNKGEKALKGEVRVTWEREFGLRSNSYRPGNKRTDTQNDNQWCDEIGRMEIDIPAGVRFWKGLINCKVTKYYDYPITNDGVGYCCPIIHMYWRAVGDTEWTLLRLDADYLFNNDYDGKDLFNETLNSINIALEDWN